MLPIEQAVMNIAVITILFVSCTTVFICTCVQKSLPLVATPDLVRLINFMCRVGYGGILLCSIYFISLGVI